MIKIILVLTLQEKTVNIFPLFISITCIIKIYEAITIVIAIYSCRNWYWKRLKDLPKVTQLASAWIWDSNVSFLDCKAQILKSLKYHGQEN